MLDSLLVSDLFFNQLRDIFLLFIDHCLVCLYCYPPGHNANTCSIHYCSVMIQKQTLADVMLL